MTIVKELNELAEKMTGTNPRATTDAQAMDYIEQHYQNGGGGDTPSGGNEPLVLDITNAVDAFYDNNEDDTEYIMTSDEKSAVGEIYNAIHENNKQMIYLYGGAGLYTLANSYIDTVNGFTICGIFNYYFQGVVTVMYLYLSGDAVYIAKRDYTTTTNSQT